MNGLVQQLYDWRLYLLPVLLYGILPGVVLRLAVYLYPREDERRVELVNELYSLPRWKRPMWVGEQLETALFEGLQERRRSRRRRKALNRPEPAGPVDPSTPLAGTTSRVEELRRKLEEAVKAERRADRKSAAAWRRSVMESRRWDKVRLAEREKRWSLEAALGQEEARAAEQRVTTGPPDRRSVERERAVVQMLLPLDEMAKALDEQHARPSNDHSAS